MKIRLDAAAREPLSAQVRSAVASRIVAGRLAPGERLPTVRDLASELHLAPNTVAKAYRGLEAEGLVVGRGRHGTFVAENVTVGRRERGARLAEAAETYVRRSRQLGYGPSSVRTALEDALRRRA
jgi:GntR family transcriptional regulator